MRSGDQNDILHIRKPNVLIWIWHQIVFIMYQWSHESSCSFQWLSELFNLRTFLKTCAWNIIIRIEVLLDWFHKSWEWLVTIEIISISWIFGNRSMFYYSLAQILFFSITHHASRTRPDLWLLFVLNMKYNNYCKCPF